MNTLLRFFVIAGFVAAMRLSVAVLAGEAPPPTTPQAGSRHQIGNSDDTFGDPAGTTAHQWIAQEAYLYYKSRFPASTTNASVALEMNGYLGTIAASLDNNNNNVLEGTADEDRMGRNPWGRPEPYMCHFCAGADGPELFTGLRGIFLSAYTVASDYWLNVIV